MGLGFPYRNPPPQKPSTNPVPPPRATTLVTGRFLFALPGPKQGEARDGTLLRHSSTDRRPASGPTVLRPEGVLGLDDGPVTRGSDTVSPWLQVTDSVGQTRGDDTDGFCHRLCLREDSGSHNE